MIVKDLIEVNRRLSHDLWNVSFFGDKPSGLSPRLIFPKKRKKNKKGEDIKRISEQEARILYCNILNNLNYFYSIETPTLKPYQLSGTYQLSALSDLSLYCFNGSDYIKKANVELKAHNVTKDSILKDIRKLTIENYVGNWFHTLKNIDKNTLPVLFNKFKQANTDVNNFIKKNKIVIDEISIVFSFCILEKKWSFIKHFKYNFSTGKSLSTFTEEFFCLSKISDSNNIKDKNVLKQKDILKNNSWTIIET